MSKLSKDGKPIYIDKGKVMKGLFQARSFKIRSMMKDNYYWILLGVAVRILIYLE